MIDGQAGLGDCNPPARPPRVHEKGLISNPVNKNKSVVLSEEGERESERLFREMFVIRK